VGQFRAINYHPVIVLSLDLLIRKGYLPKELPPPFQTTQFADALPSITLMAAEKPSSSKAMNFSIPKAWPSRRLLSIPNPLHQVRLSQTIADNWLALNELFGESKFSLSTPLASLSRSRAVSRKFSFDQWSWLKFERSAGYRFVMRTDFSRFYQTIYTHSLPWAIHGKARAKANKGNALYGNKLDACVRNTQDQQTIGLPVGPDTSFILSELVGAEIDRALAEQIPNLVGIRYVDDLSLYVETRAEAEAAYSSLARVAKQFELELNEGKTSIFEGPDVGQPAWKTVLHVFYVRKGGAQRASLLSFIERAFELAQLHRNQGVLAYAVKKLSAVELEETNADLFEAFLRAAMMSDSDIIPTVLKVIFDRNANGKLVYLDELFSTLGRLAIQHASARNDYEVAWTLWCYRVFERPIPVKVQAAVSGQDNPIIALVALECREQGIADELDTKVWEPALVAGNFYSENWLLTYEAARRGWLVGDAYNELLSEPFFSQLHAYDVSFFEAPAGSGVDYISLSSSYTG